MLRLCRATIRSSIVCFFGRVFSLFSRYRLQQHAPSE